MPGVRVVIEGRIKVGLAGITFRDGARRSSVHSPAVMHGLPVVGAASGDLATFHRNPGPCGRAPPAAAGPPALPSPAPRAGYRPRTGPAGVSPGIRPSASAGARRGALSASPRAGSWSTGPRTGPAP